MKVLPVLAIAVISAAVGAAPIATPALRFDEVSAEAGLTSFRHVGGSTPDKRYISEVMSGGVCASDFDGDGWTDVLLINGGSFESAAGKAPAPSHGVFRNTGGGRFTDITATSGIRNAGWGMGCAIADYDNDGDADVYITNFLAPNQLWQNDGKARFRDVSQKSGAAGPPNRWNTGATFGDYDGDGRLDLFVAGYVRLDPASLPEPGEKPDCRHRGLVVNCGPRGLPGEGDLLFHNDGDGVFSRVTEAIDPKNFYGLGAAFLPLEAGRPPLLYVANDSTPNALYTFDERRISEVALESGVALSEEGHEQAGMGIGWGDYDGDGRIDLFVTNFVDDYNTLYRNLGKQIFEDVTRRTDLAQPAWLFLGWGTAFGDFDRDGLCDIVAANGHVYPQVDELNLPSKWHMPLQVFQNVKGTRFVELPRSAVPGSAAGRGLAVADFWNDGRLGWIVNNLDGTPALYRPSSTQNRYLELILEGATIRDATGAHVDIRWSGGRAIRLAVSGGSYLSSHDHRVHAGVGTAGAVDVEITWPGGRRQTISGLATNRIYRVREGSTPSPLRAP